MLIPRSCIRRPHYKTTHATDASCGTIDHWFSTSIPREPLALYADQVSWKGVLGKTYTPQRKGAGDDPQPSSPAWYTPDRRPDRAVARGASLHRSLRGGALHPQIACGAVSGLDHDLVRPVVQRGIRRYSRSAHQDAWYLSPRREQVPRPGEFGIPLYSSMRGSTADDDAMRSVRSVSQVSEINAINLKRGRGSTARE